MSGRSLSSLANDRYATLIGQRLFLPNKWTENSRSCDKARVPKESRERCLIITQTLDEKGDIKFSLSNGRIDQCSLKQYAWFQSQRYWVERCFEDAKNELGLSDYQVRKWLSWQHHHSLVLMACLFIMKLKLENKIDYPLLSVRDARILMIVKIFGTEDDFKRRLEQMAIRHRKRQANIDRHYRDEYKI